jgi:hypothetical protein
MIHLTPEERRLIADVLDDEILEARFSNTSRFCVWVERPGYVRIDEAATKQLTDRMSGVARHLREYRDPEGT